MLVTELLTVATDFHTVWRNKKHYGGQWLLESEYMMTELTYR